MRRTRLPSVGREVTHLCVGTSPLGSAMTFAYGEAVDDASASATINAVLNSSIRFLDTSNAYGEAERRIGDVLMSRGLPSRPDRIPELVSNDAAEIPDAIWSDAENVLEIQS